MKTRDEATARIALDEATALVEEAGNHLRAREWAGATWRLADALDLIGMALEQLCPGVSLSGIHQSTGLGNRLERDSNATATQRGSRANDDVSATLRAGAPSCKAPGKDGR